MTYEIQSTIRINKCKSKSDARNWIQMMLNDFEDCNPGCPDITISIHDIQ